jgi:hypothetical protein
MASLPRFVKTLPVPLFGSVGTATAFLGAKARTLPRFAGWIAPLGAGAFPVFHHAPSMHSLSRLHTNLFVSIHIQSFLCVCIFLNSKGALWFVWPAVDDSWKISVGIKADPEAAKAAATAAAPSKASEEQSALAKLPSSAMKQIEDAPKAHAGHGETDEDKLLAKAAKTGDFTYLEEKWEEFAEKASRPGEDDEEEEEEEGEEGVGFECCDCFVLF